MMFGRRPIANITLSETTVLRSDSVVTIFVAGFLDRRDGMPAGHGDAARAHLVAQVLAHIVVEAAQDILAAIDQRHFAAEAGEDAGELHRDIAAALDDDALGQFGQMERLVRRDHVFEPGNFRPVMRPAAGGDQDGLGPALACRSPQAHACGRPRTRRGS